MLLSYPTCYLIYFPPRKGPTCTPRPCTSPLALCNVTLQGVSAASPARMRPSGALPSRQGLHNGPPDYSVAYTCHLRLIMTRSYRKLGQFSALTSTKTPLSRVAPSYPQRWRRSIAGRRIKNDSFVGLGDPLRSLPPYEGQGTLCVCATLYRSDQAARRCAKSGRQPRLEITPTKGNRPNL